MFSLLKVAATVEILAGLTLTAIPSVFVRLLLGAELSGAGIPLGRVAGFALLALGIACWPPGEAVGKWNASLCAMLTYNSLTATYLLFLGIRGKWTGKLLWPAVLLHAAIAVACITFLPKKTAPGR